jgi:hypothetical protein
MGHFDLVKIDKKELEKMILFGTESSTTIFVACNNILSILEAALAVSAKIKTHDVFYQPNSDFYADMEIGEICTTEYYKQKFDDYCNYFDKHRSTLIVRINKTLFNYSKNSERFDLTDYPKDIKMILIIENFNFWDLNSQSYMAQLSEKNPNIIVIGQLRSDFDFAMNHIDIGVRSGKGGGSFVRLEE